MAGAAKNSFMKKCLTDAATAVSKEGKPLSGAAKNSYMQKCEKTSSPRVCLPPVRVALARLNTADTFTAAAAFLLLAFDLSLTGFSFGGCECFPPSLWRLSGPGPFILFSLD